jgi:hypothetical protein
LKPRIFYNHVPYQCDLTCHSNFFSVAIQFIKQGIIVLGSYFNTNRDIYPAFSTSFQEAFNVLLLSLYRICGHVTFPLDNSAKLKEALNHSALSLYATSDASLKDDKATRAWIISVGNIENITDNEMNTSGAGPVDGDSCYIFSSTNYLWY